MRFIGSDNTNTAPTPDSVLAGLDSDQRTAVTAPVGIVVVRAGAGSGKTTVLTRRIAWRALNDTADIERCNRLGTLTHAFSDGGRCSTQNCWTECASWREAIL